MNINIIGDYHTHTSAAEGSIKFVQKIFGKHARGSIKENAAIAMERNLREIAITEHGYKHLFYGMAKEAYKDTRKIIDELNQEFIVSKKDFKLLLGVEANIITVNGDIDVDEDILQYLDIICAGFHKGILGSRRVGRNFTEAAKNAMVKYDIAILNHPRDRAVVDILEVGKVAIQRNTALEINRYHGNMTVQEIIKLKELGAMFSLGSDSHDSHNIGRFGSAYDLALKAGLTDDDIVNADGAAHKKLKLLR